VLGLRRGDFARYPLVEILGRARGCSVAVWPHVGSTGGVRTSMDVAGAHVHRFDTQPFPTTSNAAAVGWTGVNLFGVFVPLRAPLSAHGRYALWTVYWLFKPIRGKEGGYGIAAGGPRGLADGRCFR
jgi:hypothetical protein